MNRLVLAGFLDELTKLSADPWERLEHLVDADKRKRSGQVDYLFSPRSGPDRWGKLDQNVRSYEFLDRLVNDPRASDRLRQYARDLHGLSRGETVGKIESTSHPGRMYEIKKMHDGRMACTCDGWRFAGTHGEPFACRHIKAWAGQEQR